MNNIIEFTPNGENTIKFVNSLLGIFFKECLGKTYDIAKDGNDKPSDVESVKIRLINLPKDVKDLLKWLDESTMFSFRFKSNNNISLDEKSYRGYLNDGIMLRETKDENCIYKICNASVYITLDLNIYDIPDDENERINILLKKLSVLRETLVHEISHIYDDYKNLATNENKEKSSKDESFDVAYNHIIKNINSSNDDERYLCKVVYQTNRYETFAYISEFYQILLNEIEINGERLKDILSYDYYKRYYYIHEYIDLKLKDNIFSKYKRYITNIYGSTVDTIKTFKINVKFICRDVMDNMVDLYRCAKDVEYDFFENKTKSFDLKGLERVYKEYKNNKLENNLKNIREDHKPVYKTYFEHYQMTPIDIQIDVLKKLIELVS